LANGGFMLADAQAAATVAFAAGVPAAAPELVPVIAQDADSREVLMLAWADRAALARALATGQGWYYSRGRRAHWRKGATSGNTQELVTAQVDCDRDAVLFTVRQTGPACHTGHRSCFFTPLSPETLAGLAYGQAPPGGFMGGKLDPSGTGRAAAATAFVGELVGVIADRARQRPAGSYVGGLLSDETGLRPLQKVGEEAVEFVLAAAAMRSDDNALTRAAATGEAADLLFHYLVALQATGLTLADVAAELKNRHENRTPSGSGAGGTSPTGKT
jgi:phosphoribosyl-ATP pyrophosphohydrolase/phosphoribosyl-AMP cyclohydrolase